MKIAFFMVNQLEYTGGAEKYFIETANSLSEKFNVQADVITVGPKLSNYLGKLLTIYYLKNFTVQSNPYKETTDNIRASLNPAKYVKCDSIRELRSILNHYDVVYSKNEILEGLLFKFLIGYKTLPPIIFGCHTTLYYPQPSSFRSHIHNALYLGSFYRWLAGGVKGFHVLNASDEKCVKKLFRDRRVMRISNPFNFNEFMENSKRYKFNYQFNTARVNILWLGRLTEQKGVNDLVAIINAINATPYSEKIVWNIIGDGEEKSKIIDLQDEWNNVHFFGYVEHNYISNILDSTHLFISTSKWEGLPFNVIEAQAKNIPVIAYNIFGTNHIIDDKQSGILVRDKECFIKEVKNFLDKRYTFKNSSVRIKERYNPEVIYKQLIGMFSKVTS